MSARLYVSFDSDALQGLDNTNPASTDLTDYQTSMLLQAVLLLKLRYLWDTMSDAQWEQLNAEIADVIDKVTLFP